jgi:hypothetical protein
MSDEQFSDGEYRNQGLGTVRNAAGTKRDDGPMEVVRFRAKDREEIMLGTPWGRRELLKVMSAGAAAGFLPRGTRNAAAQQVKWSTGTEPRN